MENKQMSQRQRMFRNPHLIRMSETQLQQRKYNQQPLAKIVQQQQQPSSRQQQQQQQQEEQNTPNHQAESSCCPTSNIKDYSLSWMLFISALTIYLLIWLTTHYSIQRLTSYYYLNQFNISPYTNIDYWKLSLEANNITTTTTTTQVYVKSTTLYESRQSVIRGDAVALSLVCSWIMWKLPLTIYTLKIIISNKSHTVLRYSTWGFYLILLLLVDIMTTVFRPQGYQDWIYFCVYFLLSIVLLVVNGLVGKSRVANNIKNYLLPITYIALAYACYTTLIPGIYHSIYNTIHQDSPYLIVHVFPIIDFISYTLIIAITYYCDHHAVKFIKMLHFLNTGYAIGHVILFSPDDVEFYYLSVYFVIRNIVLNWVVQKAQKYVVVPVPLPGWIIVYLVSLATNFIPLVGLGRLVVSKSFYSQILQLTLPIQSYKLPKDYFVYYANKLPSISTFNPSLQTNIQISSVFIIWVLTSITQKYHISKIQVKQIFFYIFAIYLFYFGMTTATQLYYLQSNSL